MLKVKSIKQFLKDSPTSNITNWMYHHPTLLHKAHILTGDNVHKELTYLADRAVDKGSYLKAMNAVCKLVDVKVHPDSFYDSNSYEWLDPTCVKNRVLKILQ